jgi:hypothetical protein
MDPRPEVANYIAWGNLIKRWAKGEQPVPTSLPDLLNQCAAANVGMMMPPFVTDIAVVQQPKNVFVLRLPPGDLVKQSEDALKAGGAYTIPGFYDQRYHTTLNIPQDQKLDFHAQRTGDYVIRLCQ